MTPARQIFMVVVGTQFSDFSRLHKTIVEDPETVDWWHWLNTTYILVSKDSIAKMQDKLHAAFPTDNFLVIDVNPKAYGGWLPQEAWDWLRRFKHWIFTFPD